MIKAVYFDTYMGHRYYRDCHNNVYTRISDKVVYCSNYRGKQLTEDKAEPYYEVKDVELIEEDPRTLTLPCAIGDPVYIIVSLHSGEPHHINTQYCTGIHITDDRAFKSRTGKVLKYLVVTTGIERSQHIDMSLIGTRVFFSHEEASIALQKLRKDFERSHSDERKDQ